MDSGQIILYSIAALMAFMYGRRWLMTRSVQQYSPTDARERVRSGQAVFIDVRRASERSLGTIQGSIHVPLNELGRRMEEFERYRGKELIFFCATGSRSVVAAAQAEKQGFSVANLSGGMGSWNLSAR